MGIAFITQLRTELTSHAANWQQTAQARVKALQGQFKQKCSGHCTSETRAWFTTNIKHLQEVARNPAPHLEISWTTRFNAFLPCDNCTDVKQRFNYLLPSGAFPNSSFVFETDNEGKWFWPQIHHLVDTVNIMAYDEGAYGGKPFRLDFATILDNFARYGKIPPSKINMGFEPSIHQAAHGIWEGEAVDESVAKEIVNKKTAGGVALWAVNPTPSKTNNASVLCKNAAEALHNIV